MYIGVYCCSSDCTSLSTLFSSATCPVFESALTLLFSICKFCLGRMVDVSKMTVSTLLWVTQKCSNCRWKFVWEGQTFIGNVPAGNLLTSAAILYASAWPTKALRIFSILTCVIITLTTFFRHQRMYLQPVVSSIWEKQQLSLISSFKGQKKKLALSGDGRADSPSHSAKYGSYTVLEMTCNKVVDYRLVQVSTKQYLTLTCDSSVNSN